MEYYPAFEKKEILTHSTTWMNLGEIMPWEQKPVTET
jgi:hypothetical protein